MYQAPSKDHLLRFDSPQKRVSFGAKLPEQQCVGSLIHQSISVQRLKIPIFFCGKFFSKFTARKIKSFSARRTRHRCSSIAQPFAPRSNEQRSFDQVAFATPMFLFAASCQTKTKSLTNSQDRDSNHCHLPCSISVKTFQYHLQSLLSKF